MTTRQLVELRTLRVLYRVRRMLSLRRVAVLALVLFGLGCASTLAADWLQIRGSLDPYDFHRHLDCFPFSPFSWQAYDRLAGETEWPTVEASSNPSELRRFVDYATFARLRIKRLDEVASGRYTPVFPDSLQRGFDTIKITWPSPAWIAIGCGGPAMRSSTVSASAS